jgi:hypothetical protein
MVQDVPHPVDFALESLDTDCLSLVGNSAGKAAELAYPMRERCRHEFHLYLSIAGTRNVVQDQHHALTVIECRRRRPECRDRAA